MNNFLRQKSIAMGFAAFLLVPTAKAFADFCPDASLMLAAEPALYLQRPSELRSAIRVITHSAESSRRFADVISFNA